MAVIGGQTDRFGNKIPPNQSVKVFINADGTVPQQREIVLLDSTITATDDPVTQATKLSVANTGTVAGRLLIPVLIDTQNLSAATSYASPAWVAGLYRELELMIIVTTGAGADVTVALTGLTGAYAGNTITSNGTIMLTVNTASWIVSPYATGHTRCNMCILNGLPRTFEATVSRGTGTFGSRVQGTNADTTHDVTGLTFSTGPLTGTVYLKGILA